MTIRAPLHSLLVLLAGLAGCGTHQGVATRPVESLDDLKRGEASTGLDTGGPMTIGQLRILLMTHADRTIAALERADGPALAADSSPDARLALQLLRAGVASTAVALAIEPDANAALVDLLVSTTVQRQAVARSAGSTALSDASRTRLITLLEHLEENAWSIGARIHPPDKLAQLRAQAGHFAESAESTPTYGIVRLADLAPAGAAPTLAGAKGIFAPIDEANRQIEETRLLGERLLFLTERLPLLSRWQAEALAWEALGAPESRRALSGLAVMSASLERLSLQAESLPGILDRQRHGLLADFDAREGALRRLLGQATALARQGRAAAESGERLMALSEQTAASLNQTVVAVNALVAALRDSSAPGGAVDLNVAHYAATVSDLRAALEALNSALANGEGAAGRGRGLVDHIAWRTAQLVLLLFLLLLGYRWAGGRLTR